MANTSKRSWLKALVPLGIGIAAGIGCCALPLLAGLGIGAASLGGAAAFLEPLAAISIGIGATLSAGLLFAYVHHRRKAANHLAGASCSADGSCGCGPRSKARDTEAAGSCDLPGADAAARMARIRALLQAHLIGRRRTAAGFVWTLRGARAIEDDVREILALESKCCPSIQFTIRRDGDNLVCEATAPTSDRALMDLIFSLSDAATPDESARKPRTSQVPASART